MAEDVKSLKSKLGEEKNSSSKSSKQTAEKKPEKTSEKTDGKDGNGLGAKAFNMAKDSVGSKMKDGVDSAISTGMNQGDEQTGETSSQMAQDLQGMQNLGNNISNINNMRKDFGAAKANKDAAEYMKKLDGEGAKALANAGGAQAKGASAAKAGAKGLKAGAASMKKGLSTAIKALFSNPIGWIILGVLLLIMIVLLIVVIVTGSDQDAKQAGAYEGNPLSGSDTEVIEQTANGIYYQKYSDMSIYANVDMSQLETPSEEIQNYCGDAANYQDPCSDKSFTDLTGVDPETIDQDKLYQEGTHDWLDLNIEDLNGNEKLIALSAGTLSQLDQKLNINFKYPEQFIRPVAANCTINMADFLANDENDIDGDGKVTIKDCRIRNYDEDGNPVELTEDAEGHTLEKDYRYWMDHTLYLYIARSQEFKTPDGKVAEEADSYATVSMTPPDTDHIYQSDGLWNYGLGTLAHYVGYFQPSRVTGYGIETIDVICTGDDLVGNNIPSNGICAGAKFGEVVTVDRHTVEENEALIKEIFKGGACNEEGENADGCGGSLYIPYSDIYFKKWIDGYEKYTDNLDKLTDGDDFGYVYTNGLEDGEYPVTTITDTEEIFNEPAISTGIPVTEVKYIIDHAVTFAGTVKFDVKQQWVNQAIAEHSQRLLYTITKNLEVPVDASIKEQDVTKHNPEEGTVIDYEYDVCYYYDNGMSVCGFSEDDKFVWIPAKTETTEDGTDEEDDCSRRQWIIDPNVPAGGYWTPCDKKTVTLYKHTYTPGHYELNGRIFYKGKEVQLSDIQKSETDKNSSNNYPGTKPDDDDKSKYTWGETQTAIITSHKEGYLQTFALYSANSVPDTKEIVGLDYFDDYVDNYQTIVPEFNDGLWDCYNPNNDPNDKEWKGEDGSIKNFEYASQFSKGEDSGKKMDPVTGIVNGDGKTNLFCYAPEKEDLGSAAPSLYFGSRPLLQVASYGGRLKFQTTKEGRLLKDVSISFNKIMNSPSTSNDTRFRTLGTKYAKEFVNFAGMYGVDPTLAALIAAETGAEEGNLMGVTGGDYKAYNLGTRSPSTEHYGGSHDSTVNNSVWERVKEFFSKIPFFSRKTHERDTVDHGSKEDLHATVNDGEITAINNDDGEEVEGLTQEELSIKLASMQIQYLQEVYQYNMPMVITAYRYGRDYVEAILDIYERTTGVTRAEAITSTMDTGWADFRAALYPDEDATEAERETAELLRTDYDISEETAAGAADYVERVLSRLLSNGIYYQKVDREYLELSADDTAELEEIRDVESNTAQHSIGIWMLGVLRDTVKENDMTSSRQNRSNMLRAWNILTKETGTVEEEDWYEITGGQVKYPEKTWDYGEYGVNTDILYPNKEYFHFKPDISDEDKDLLISDLMTFGQDADYAETNYSDIEFWRNHYASMFGTPNKNWKSSMSAVELFGENPDRIDEFDRETINRYLFTSNMPTIVTPYGYSNTKNNRRENSSRTVYQIQESKDGVLDKHVVAPFDGKVVEVGENNDGKYVEISVDNYKGVDASVLVEMLDTVEVKKGDVINDVTIIGDVNETSKLLGISMMYNGNLVDFNEVYYSFPASYDYDSWIPSTNTGPGGWIGGGGRGDELNPFPGDPDIVAGEIEDVDGLVSQVPRWFASDGWQSWNTVYISNSPGNPFGEGQCTAIAWEIMSRLYPDKDWSFPSEGNGDQWASSACKYNGFNCTNPELMPGTIISSRPNHVVVVTEVHNNGDDLDYFCVISGNVNNSRRAARICYHSLGEMATLSKRSWYQLASPR